MSEEITPAEFYQSYKAASLDGTMSRLAKMAALLRGDGYYGLIILYSREIFTGASRCNSMHVFRLYHPGMAVRKGWVFTVEKSVARILRKILSPAEFKQAYRKTTHWTTNISKTPIAPTGHMLPMWCDVAYEMPIAGTAPAAQVFVEVNYPVPPAEIRNAGHITDCLGIGGIVPAAVLPIRE